MHGDLHVHAAFSEDNVDLEESIERLIAQLENELESVTNEIRPPPVCGTTSYGWNYPSTDLSATSLDHRLSDTPPPFTSPLTSPLTPSDLTESAQLPESEPLSVSGSLDRLNGTAEFENMNWNSSQLFNGKGESGRPSDSLGDFDCKISSSAPETQQSVVANNAVVTSRDSVVTSRELRECVNQCFTTPDIIGS